MKRTAQALIWAIVAIAGVAWLRPVARGGMSESVFWLSKFLAPPSDVVLAGDSRTVMGLSPEAVGQQVHRSVFNDGWYGAVFSADYFSEIDRHLTKEAGRRAVVLGVTPLSLTRQAETWSRFLEYARRPRLALRFDAWTSPLTEPFTPLVQLYNRGQPVAFRAAELDGARRLTRHPNGWIAVHVVRPDPTLELSSYRKNFSQGNTSSDVILSGLCQAVRRWSSMGVSVFAYRPPTTPDMVALENELSGYDERQVSAALTSAGARWLDVSGSYETYDGSHLQEAAAVTLSSNLGRLIAARWRADDGR